MSRTGQKHGWIDTRGFCACPKCGGLNNTTGRLCSLCSINARMVNEHGFRELAEGLVRAFVEELVNG
jgi:hypothetical protein